MVAIILKVFFIFLDSQEKREMTMDKDFVKKWKRKAAVSTFTDNCLRTCKWVQTWEI